MYVDFTNLNKACPKDWYLLPRINQLVDVTASHKILSFVNAYSGYHQIHMWLADRALTAFRAAGAIYHYIMMSFRLKNTGATYQRMVNKAFGDQMGRNLEAYIDDIVIKTKQSNHVNDLEETFTNLRKNKMKLNPAKCVFGVMAVKFLGYMVNERGIEANPEKIEVLANMKALDYIKCIQQLNGRIIALSKFIAKSAEKSLPFFKVLRGSKKFSWNEECDKAFSKQKEYLGNPPLLSRLAPGKILYIYLTASDTAVAAVLLREEGTN